MSTQQHDLAALAARLRDGAPGFTDEIVDHIRTTLSPYQTGGLVDRSELATSIRVQLLGFATVLGGGEVDAAPADEIGRARAEAGIPLAEVLEAYRIGFRAIWRILVRLASAENVPPETLLDGANAVWDNLSETTAAMTSGYREVLTRRAVEDEQESSVMVGAFLAGHLPVGLTSWETYGALGLAPSAPYAVVVAEPPSFGRQALPGVRDALRVRGIRSAWRLDEDLQWGVVSLPEPDSFTRTLAVLQGASAGRVGMSPAQSSTAEAPRAARLARIALVASPRGGSPAVFGDDVLATTVVSSPEVMILLADEILSGLADLDPADQDRLLHTLLTWVDQRGSTELTSRELHVHPNTVRYRLRKLEEHTGRLVSEPRGMIELALAARARLAWTERPGHAAANDRAATDK